MMVGYNFQVIFEAQIVDRTKWQTVRAERKRHARVGETMQLFCEQRSRRCRKLLTPDPICTRVASIEICTSVLVEELIASIAIDGIPLHRDEIEAFAKADGFGIAAVGDRRFKQTGWRGSARWNMGDFWRSRHDFGRFEGVLLEWTQS